MGEKCSDYSSELYFFLQRSTSGVAPAISLKTHEISEIELEKYEILSFTSKKAFLAHFRSNLKRFPVSDQPLSSSFFRYLCKEAETEKPDGPTNPRIDQILFFASVFLHEMKGLRHDSKRNRHDSLIEWVRETDTLLRTQFRDS